MLLSYQAATSEVPFKPDMTCLQGFFDDSVNKIASLGYSGIELMTVSPAVLDALKIRKKLEESGLKPSLVCTGEMGCMGYNLGNPDDDDRKRSIERIKEAIDFAALLGTGINAGKIKGEYIRGIPRKKTWNQVVEGFTELSAYAIQKNVSIALETAGFVYMNLINTCEDAEKMIKDVNMPNFGLMMDIYHMYHEEKDLLNSIEKYSKYLLHVHLADNNRMSPGACGINFEKVIKTFHNAGYDGSFTVEIRQIPDQYTAAKNSIEYLSPLFKSVYGD
jgi:sugar phosphate isomerase/epimerase